VPLKVSIFIWRLLRDWLPAKDNFLRCDILSHDNQFCVGGCGMEETSDHFFLSCPIFDTIWSHLRNWFVILGVDATRLSNHFLQFGQLGGSYKRLQSTFIFG